METDERSNFNNIIRKIIKKSLFTERQIEIILSSRKLLDAEFSISRGAFYRQLGQSRNKMVSFYYTVILLRVLGLAGHENSDVMLDLCEKISVIKDSDVAPEVEEQVMSVIDEFIHKVCNE